MGLYGAAAYCLQMMYLIEIVSRTFRKNLKKRNSACVVANDVIMEKKGLKNLKKTFSLITYLHFVCK